MNKEIVERAQQSLTIYANDMAPHFEAAREAARFGTGQVAVERAFYDAEQSKLNRDMLRNFTEILPLSTSLSAPKVKDEWYARLALNSMVFIPGIHMKYDYEEPHILIGQHVQERSRRFTSVLLQPLTCYWPALTAEIKTRELQAFEQRDVYKKLSHHDLYRMQNTEERNLELTSNLDAAFVPRLKNIRGLDSVPAEVMQKYNVLQKLTQLSTAFGVSGKFDELLEARKESTSSELDEVLGNL